MTNNERLVKYRQSLDRFDRWMVANRGKDGLWLESCNADGWFPFAAYMHARGRKDEALFALRHIRSSFVDEDGSLIQGNNRDSIVAYVPSWIAWTAHRVGLYELANLMIKQLMSYQCSNTGGLFASKSPQTKGENRISFDVTAIGAIALAQTGRVESTVRAADYLCDLYDNQSQMDMCFVTQPPDEQLVWSKKSQYYYKIGMFCLALTQAYGATGNHRYLQVAESLHQQVSNRAEDIWQNTAAHKMAWGAEALYAATGDSIYLDHACRICDHLLSVQQDDGAFHYPELWGSHAAVPMALRANIGCQFALWITLAASVLKDESP